MNRTDFGAILAPIVMMLVAWTSAQAQSIQDGAYVLVPACAPSMRFDADHGKSLAGTGVLVWPSNLGTNQIWIIRSGSDGTFVIQPSYCGSLVLDDNCPEGSPTDTVSLWSYNGKSNQHWT